MGRSQIRWLFFITVFQVPEGSAEGSACSSVKTGIRIAVPSV